MSQSKFTTQTISLTLTSAQWGEVINQSAANRREAARIAAIEDAKGKAKDRPKGTKANGVVVVDVTKPVDAPLPEGIPYAEPVVSQVPALEAQLITLDTVIKEGLAELTRLEAEHSQTEKELAEALAAEKAPATPSLPFPMGTLVLFNIGRSQMEGTFTGKCNDKGNWEILYRKTPYFRSAAKITAKPVALPQTRTPVEGTNGKYVVSAAPAAAQVTKKDPVVKVVPQEDRKPVAPQLKRSAQLAYDLTNHEVSQQERAEIITTLARCMTAADVRALMSALPGNVRNELGKAK